MERTIYVTPVAGRTVLDPVTREALPAAGKTVPRSSYWVRRLRDGDVVEATFGRGKGPHLKAVPNPKAGGKDGDK
jgi:hypothetical protein